MAAVVTEKSIERAASPEALLAGRRLHASGAVSETAGAYAGAGGFVVDDTGTTALPVPTVRVRLQVVREQPEARVPET